MANRSSSKAYTSKGERRSVNKYICKAMRREYMASGARIENQWKAYEQGKRVMITIPNPAGKAESNKPFIRVPMEDIMGSEYRKIPKFQMSGK